MEPHEILFVGVEGSPQTHYRCRLPAEALGCDWIGVTLDFHVVCGSVRGKPTMPNLEDYKVVVAQYAVGDPWFQRIEQLKALGIKVVYEMDDFLHGIKDIDGHVHQGYFTRSILRAFERGMGMADALIVTNDFLRQRYGKLCPGPTYVCKNGIDLPRFDLHRPPRQSLTVGWAGATGHVSPMLDWLNGGVADAIRAREDARFVAIGAPEVGVAAKDILGDKASSVPFGSLESYPAAMSDCDVMLAPAGRLAWHRGKSDLRWLEASALGLPSVCDALAYPDAGCRAENAADAAQFVTEFLDVPSEARAIGEVERKRVRQLGRAFPQAAEQWREPLGL